MPCGSGHYSGVEETMLLNKEITYYDDYCTGCEEGYYSTVTGAFGTEDAICIPCTYPYTTISTGSDSCSCVSISASTIVIVILFVLAVLAFFMMIVNYEMKNRIAIFLVFVFPFMDTLTNLAYILTSKFYNMATFVCCVLFCCHAIPMFMYSVYQSHAYPSVSRYIWWLGYSTSAYDSVLSKEVMRQQEKAKQRLQGSGVTEKEEEVKIPTSAMVTSNRTVVIGGNSVESEGGADNNGGEEEGIEEGDHIPYPTIFNRRIGFLFDLSLHDSIFALFLELLYWMLAIAAQLFSLLLVPMFFMCWFIYGCILQMTKFITISSLYNNWYQVWTSTDEYDDVGLGGVDTQELNYYLLCQFVFETLPMIIIQIINNSLLHTWVSSPFAIFSFIMSIVMLLNVLYKYVFQTYILATPNKMKNIPIDRSLRINIPWLRLNIVIVNGKLEPYSKRFRYQGFTTLNQSLLPLEEDEEAQEDAESSNKVDNNIVTSTTTTGNSNTNPITITANTTSVNTINSNKSGVVPSSYGKKFVI